MVEHQVQEIRQQVYSLERAIGGLLSSVTTLTSTWARQDQEAGEGRRRLHEKVDALVSRVTELGVRVEHMAGEIAAMRPSVARVEQIEDDVEQIKPSMTAFERGRQREIGSKKTLAVIWAALFAFAGAVGGIAVKLIELFWSPPRH